MRLFRTAGIDASESHALRLRPLVLAVSTPNLDDDVGRARHRQLARRLNALALDVGKDVRPACGVEHVVQESDGAARVNASKRFGVAAEHEQRARPRPPCDPLSDVGNLRFDAVGERRAFLCAADARAKLANGRRDVREGRRADTGTSGSSPARAASADRSAFRTRRRDRA